MTDIIDRAQQTEARNLAQSLRLHAAIASQQVRPAPRGECLNTDCGEPFEPNTPQLFCGPPCAERFEILTKRR